MNQHSNTCVIPGSPTSRTLFAVPPSPPQTPSLTGPSNKLPLWLAFYFPKLSLEVVTSLAENTPAVAFEQQRQAYRIITVNDAANQAGIRPDMTLTTARAMVPQLKTFPRDQRSEQQILEKLASRATRWTPAVVIREDCLLMEIAGSLKLYGGLQSLLISVDSWIQTEAHRFQTAVTPTPASAILSARAGRTLCVTDRGQLVSHLRDLPVGWLNLGRRRNDLLNRLGIHKIGGLLRLPRHGLARRLNPTVLNQLDQLIGRTADPQLFYTPPLTFYEDVALIQDVDSIEFLLPAIEHLLNTMGVQLKHSCTAANHLNWILTDDHGYSLDIPVQMSCPRRETQVFLKLSRLAFEAIQLKRPITHLALKAKLLTSIPEDNDTLITDNCNFSGDPTVLLDSLQNRLGFKAVQGIRLNPDHRPEQSWMPCSPGELGPTFQSSPRPLWLLHRPRHMDIKHGQPCLQGKPLLLDKQIERISSGWWDKNPVKRDYYLASNNQLRVWIFRDLGSGQWYLHGIF